MSATQKEIFRPPVVEGDIAIIPLTKGQVAIVDRSDADLVGQWNWMALPRPGGRGHYAVTQDYTKGRQKTIYMHRLLLNAPRGVEVDHIDRETLNNRRSNLRLASHSENKWNTAARKNNTSGYKGVHYEKRRGHYIALAYRHGKRHYFGSFATAEEAYAAYCQKVKKLHGEFARVE
jgi:hypothetical protein